MAHRIIRSWYSGRWWVGCYNWYSEEGTGWDRSPPSPLLAVPNVTAHPSTATVPITVILLYDGPLLCGFNVAIKGLNPVAKARALRCDNVHLSVRLSVRLFVCSFVCRLKRVLIGHWPDWPSSATMLDAVSGRSTAGPARPVSYIPMAVEVYRVVHTNIMLFVVHEVQTKSAGTFRIKKLWTFRR